MYRSNSVQGQIKYSLFSAKTIGLHLKRKQNRTFLHLKNNFFLLFLLSIRIYATHCDIISAIVLYIYRFLLVTTHVELILWTKASFI